MYLHFEISLAMQIELVCILTGGLFFRAFMNSIVAVQ